jgi:hypothetical protein
MDAMDPSQLGLGAADAAFDAVKAGLIQPRRRLKLGISLC